MNAERWENVKELLHRAMQLSPEQRARFLEEACPADCRTEVESLLVADECARSGFLKSLSSVEHAGESDSVFTVLLAPGDLFEARFQLMERLGEGGMGQVWRARQVAPVRREVALKLIKSGMYDKSVMQRFTSERQSIAIMDHPTIAKVFEAGATAQGQPFLVMEYVPGLPITEHCDQKRLTISNRLELLAQVCDGIQHAHQKAIVHRDLKPANILVVEVDGKPVPRIIDFGIAKAMTPLLGADGELTLCGQFIGTPGYMSPEQVDPTIRDVDTRTDVYSLGVLLYVLLTGYQPFDMKLGARPALDVLLRKLREEEPPPPSAKIGIDHSSSIEVARARGLDPRQLVQRLRGDLDWITMKALERDRTRRYGTPSELAADVRRFLNDEPVIARPASAGYRIRKYVRRHRLAVAIATGLVALLTGFSNLQRLELRRTTQERDRANLERDRANSERDRAARIIDFMTGMFKVSDPSEARGNSITAREILDKAATDIDTGLAQDAVVRSQMLQVMANTYLNLGMYARARDLSSRAFDVRDRILGPKDPATLESMSQLGWILDRQGHDADAEKLERQALEEERRVLGPEAAPTLDSMDHLAVIEVDEGHYAAAESLARQVAESAARTLGAENSQTLLYFGHLARALWYLGRYSDAEQQYEKLLEVDRRLLGPDHPQTLAAMNGLASTALLQRRLPEAERLYREVVAAEQRVLGPEHQYTVQNLQNLATVLEEAGHLVEGEKLNRQVLAIRLRTLGAEHPDTLSSQVNLVNILVKEGRIAEADKLQRDTLAIQRRVLGPEEPTILTSQANLTAILMREHRYAAAEKLAGDTLDVQRRILGRGHPDTLYSLRYLGMAMSHRHRYAEASRLIRSTIDQLVDDTSQGNRWSVWYSFACVAAAGGRFDEAIRYLREAVNRGYLDAEGLLADDDLKSLRHNAQFLALIADLQTASKQPS